MTEGPDHVTIRCWSAETLRSLCSIAAAVAVAAAVGLSPTAAEAQSPEVTQLRERLQENRVQVESAETAQAAAFRAVTEAQAALAAVDRSLDAAAGRLAELEAELVGAERVLDDAVGRLTEAERRLVLATRRLLRSQENLDRHVAELHRQIASAYMYGGAETTYLAAAVDAMSASSSVTDYLTTLDKLQVGADRKGDVVTDVERSVAEVESHRRDVDRFRRERGMEESWDRRARDALAALIDEQATLVERITRERAERERILTEVEAEQERAEALLDELAEESEALTAELGRYRWHAGAPGAGGLAWPTDGRVTSGFGLRLHPILDSLRRHHGIDIPAPSGQPVVAAADGEVVSAGARGGYGLTVVIAHGGGVTTLYAHLSRLDVRGGQEVRQGDRIGAVGTTGLSTGPHLHFEVRRDGEPSDPMAWF